MKLSESNEQWLRQASAEVVRGRQRNGPTVGALGELDLFFTQWLAVGFLGILLVRRSVPDMAVHNNERRTVAGLEAVVRFCQLVEVVGVGYVEHAPSIAFKSFAYIFGE